MNSSAVRNAVGGGTGMGRVGEGGGGKSSLTVQTTATECVNDSRLVITGDQLIPRVAVIMTPFFLGGGRGEGC